MLERALVATRADAAWVGWRLAELLPLSQQQRQQLLEEDDPDRRLDVMLGLIL